MCGNAMGGRDASLNIGGVGPTQCSTPCWRPNHACEKVWNKEGTWCKVARIFKEGKGRYGMFEPAMSALIALKCHAIDGFTKIVIPLVRSMRG